MNNDAEGRLYDRPASERSSTNKLNAEKAAKLDGMQAESINRDAYRAGEQKGVNSIMAEVDKYLVNNYALQEGSPQAYEMDDNMARGANYGLLDEVEGLVGAQQPQPEQNIYQEEAAQSENDLIEDAQTSAFITAQDMGDTSEENMNKLLIAELQARGIQ